MGSSLRRQSFFPWALLRNLLVLCCAISFCTPAAAEKTHALKGVALVIGNGDYEHIAKLTNPPNDARAIEEMLDGLGFDTTIASDRNARRLKRDLDSFVEDAEGADVAVIYYSGHGIEAGGENYLVPVDADLAALDEAKDRLVPLSDIVAALKQSVPVTIVMLDACRSDPFPPGTLVKAAPSADGAPIGGGGLGASRGAVSIAATSSQDENFGTVIGFAAEPGRVALDGDAGGNSPYAAAILRHLSAMGGAEFGTVMRMVAEEVYLKTGGKQRPWVNESLRRLLFFGDTPPVPAGEDGDILKERRTLLLTIAALPDTNRKQIETIAASGGVPMDGLYAMLDALGAEAPKDPAELDRVMRGQAERLKGILAERAALKSDDPEITRLSGLADRALDEGALETAVKLLGQAKTRVASLDASVDDAEADIEAKRREFAAVYARSGEAHTLAFDYLAAADDYAAAYDQIRRWDDRLAWTYRRAETEALITLGNFRGDKRALDRAIRTGRDTVSLSEALNDETDNLTSRLMLGNALQAMGERESGADNLDASAAAYRDALAHMTQAGQPLMWAKTQNNLANTLATLGRRVGDKQFMEEAVVAYRQAISQFEASQSAQEWGIAQSNLGKTLLEIGELETGIERFNEAGRAFELALSQVQRNANPIAWATIWNNLGNAYFNLGDRATDRNIALGRFVQAVAAYQNALTEWTRERVPAQWAVAQGNISNAYRALAFNERNPAVAKGYMEKTEAAQRAALEEFTRERGPLQWAITTTNLARTLHLSGNMDANPKTKAAHLDKALAAYRASLEVLTRRGMPVLWASTQSFLGHALMDRLALEADPAKIAAMLTQSIAAQQASLEIYTAAAFAAARASALHDLGQSLIFQGDRGGGLESYRAAEAAFREEETLRTKAVSVVDWAKVQAGIGNSLRAIGLITRDRATLMEAEGRTREAWELIKPIDSQYDGVMSGRLQEIETALAELP